MTAWLPLAAEVFTPLKSVAALGFPAKLLVLSLALHPPFADKTPMPVEAPMATLAIEGVSGVSRGRWKLTVTVAAEMP